ncbi:MAG: flippase-like domain-containing protein [Bacteroidales bacterium]|nr:flippase-like domain-containing protein [Bacteroidales bacterium]
MKNKSVRLSKKRRKISWFNILRLAGIILFIVIISHVDVRMIWTDIKSANIWFLLLALIFQIFLLFTKGFRWHLLNVANDSGKLKQSLGEFLESYAIGVITPGRLGELMKAGHQKNRENIFASGIRVIAERGMDVGMFIFIAGIALLTTKMVMLSRVIPWLIIVVGVLIVISSILILSSAWINRFTGLFIPNFTVTFIHRKPINIINIVGLSILSNLFYFTSCYIIAVYSLNMKLSLVEVSGGVAIAGLFNLLPITIMGLGTRELTFLYVFGPLTKNLVLAFSALMLTIAQIGGGILALILGQFFLYLNKKSLN